MTGFVLQRPADAVSWELRAALASRRVVRLVLSDRCDGIARNDDGDRIIEGRVDGVSPTGAFCVIRGRHVPLTDVLAVHRVHYLQAGPSDPTDPMDRRAGYVTERMGDSAA